MGFGPGTRFGAYEITAQISFGGMGEVYRATDTTLKREVAVKVLPAAFAADADRLARFRREAEVLASLNHANIAQIFGLEQADGQTVIVMELVEGPTLAERLARGRLPPEEALAIARQIADALEAAHARQIVHRDLKPANVKLRPDGGVKVLDFGIAKTLGVQATSGGQAPMAITPAVTEVGVILGTAAYMSPEQARGQPIDQRTDIWAFGCVLFEMLTGKPAFEGEDVMLTLAHVLDRETDVSSIPGIVSPAVRRTIKLCLEKDPRKRIADIRDVRLALDGGFQEGHAPGGPATPEGLRRLLLPVAGAAAAALMAAGAAWLVRPPSQAPAPTVMRFDYALPDGVTLRAPITSVLDIAPSGESLVFNGSDGIYVRSFDDLEARAIPGTDGNISDVAVSPDGREVAYFRTTTTRELVKVPVDGGAHIVLADFVGSSHGLSWEADGTLLFGQPDGIWRISEDGGTPQRVIEAQGTEQVWGPRLLPAGEWVLFSVARTGGANRWNDADIVVQSLASGERRVLRSGGFDARYLPTGHITYVFGNALLASAFDARALELDDERVTLVEGVQTAISASGGSGFYAIASNGTLVYVPAVAALAAGRPQRSLVWVDRTGNTVPLPLRPDDYRMVRISPDGTRIALVIGRAVPVNDPPPDLYVLDLETDSLTQLTFNEFTDDGAVWSPDGSRIFFRSFNEAGVAAVYAIPSEGGTPEFLARSTKGLYPNPWSISADGRTLLIVDAVSFSDINLATLDVGADTMAPLLDLAQQVGQPVLSPSGQWLANREYGQPNDPTEITLRPFPDVRQQRRVVASGNHPVFSADGSELFFFDAAGLSVVPVQYNPLRVGAPRALFRGRYWYGIGGPDGANGRAWDVDPKNDRFLMITLPDDDVGEAAEPTRPRIRIVLNWFEELRQRVPASF
jgi:serine/threonine-protein kinase